MLRLLASALALLVLAAPPLPAQSLPDWAETPRNEASTPPPPPPPDPTRVKVDEVPVDGALGLGLLAAAGAAYAMRRLRQA